VVSRENFPPALEVTAVAENEVIMAMRHRDYAVWGLQFHPESIMTAQGMKMLQNFLAYATQRQTSELAQA
jgi:anthranilate synthase component 2